MGKAEVTKILQVTKYTSSFGKHQNLTLPSSKLQNPLCKENY